MSSFYPSISFDDGQLQSNANQIYEWKGTQEKEKISFIFYRFCWLAARKLLMSPFNYNFSWQLRVEHHSPLRCEMTFKRHLIQWKSVRNDIRSIDSVCLIAQFNDIFCGDGNPKWLEARLLFLSFRFTIHSIVWVSTLNWDWTVTDGSPFFIVACLFTLLFESFNTWIRNL